MPSFSSPPLGRTRVSSHKFFSRPTNNRSILAFLASQHSAQARQHAAPCAINLPLAARALARGMFTAQIPIAEPAARPTERTSRDFVPWRFSNAGHQSACKIVVAGVRKPAQNPNLPHCNRNGRFTPINGH
jgi:hypothetical protein